MNLSLRWLCVGACLTGALAVAAPAETLPTLLVLPLEARNGVNAELASTVTESLVGELRRSRKFRVSTLKEVEGVLTQAQRAQVAGCEAACAVELGSLVQADQILGGSLGRVGNDYVLNLNRLSARDGQALSTSSRRVPVAKETALLDVLPAVATELLEARREGDVVVQPRALPTGGGNPQAVSSVNNAKTTPGARGPIRLAIMPFDNRGHRPEFEVLSNGFADILATDLTQVEGIQVVERERLKALLDELHLQRSNAFDPATIQKLGRMLGAEYLVFGTYFEIMGNFRLDSFLVSVETTARVAGQGAQGKPADVLALEKQLVAQLLDGLAARLTDKDRQWLKAPAPTASLQDVVAYSEAVDAVDRGDRKAARAGAMVVLARVPGFVAAQQLLARLDAPR